MATSAVCFRVFWFFLGALPCFADSNEVDFSRLVEIVDSCSCLRFFELTSVTLLFGGPDRSVGLIACYGIKTDVTVREDHLHLIEIARRVPYQ